MSIEAFLDQIRGSSTDDLAQRFLVADSVCVFPDDREYITFRTKVSGLLREVERVSIVGSANWRYSLNPGKKFQEFGDHSDIDVAIISTALFHRLWEEMRLHHRRHFYTLSLAERQQLRRSGENVYSGFISPKWIPNRDRARDYEYRRLLNALSDKSVRFLKVGMLFFKNETEAIDYYARGFRDAKKGL
ncbi:MAG TPA: hypothetical protein VHX60_18585 [Acidobacteriaceae bacterium]|jgi:hypothetical protein|nr:hypothetical protein [Acidobacteriaceae bacterium]